jgi:hypothetical protein
VGPIDPRTETILKATMPVAGRARRFLAPNRLHLQLAHYSPPRRGFAWRFGLTDPIHPADLGQASKSSGHRQVSHRTDRDRV